MTTKTIRQYEVQGYVLTPYRVVITDGKFPDRSAEEQKQLVRAELYLREFQDCTVESAAVIVDDAD